MLRNFNPHLFEDGEGSVGISDVEETEGQGAVIYPNLTVIKN